MKDETKLNIGKLILLLAVLILVITLILTVLNSVEQFNAIKSYCEDLDMEYDFDQSGTNPRCVKIEGNKVIVKRLHFIDGKLYEESKSGNSAKNGVKK